MTDYLLSNIYKFNEIIIYGAGYVSNLLYSFLCELHEEGRVKAYAITSSNKTINHKNNIPILEIIDAKRRYPNALLIIAVHEFTQKEMCLYAQKIGWFNVVCLDVSRLKNNFYERLYQIPIQENKIFFSNYYGLGYGCNPKYIAEYIIKNGLSEKIDMVWGVSGEDIELPKQIRTVKIGTIDYYRELSTARIWIDNVRKTADVKKRKGQYYIQTWHGAAPFKKVEADIINSANSVVIDMGKRDSEMVDLFVSGSKFYSNLYRSSFWYDGEIIESGLPRQDLFWNLSDVNKKVRSFYQIEESKMIILYAPTFRDDGSLNSYNIDISRIKRTVKEKFGKESVFFVSKHPINRYMKYSFIKGEYVDVGNYSDFEELLVSSDILLTDYSGCIYDFSFSGKPAFMYQPDYSSMKSFRDFYIEPNEMPYPTARSLDELVNNIIEFDEKLYSSKLKDFMNQFGNFDDGHASERVCKKIFKLLGL